MYWFALANAWFWMALFGWMFPESIQQRNGVKMAGAIVALFLGLLFTTLGILVAKNVIN